MPAANADPKTLEITKEYQAKQTEINSLLRKWAESRSGKERDAFREEIVKATAEQFDLRRQIREREIEQLKQRLSEVESTVMKRNELKDKIVEKRVAELLREPDQLSWEPLEGGSPVGGQAVAPQYSTQQVPSIPLGQPTGVNPSKAAARWVTTYEPRQVTRIEQKTIVNSDGKEQVITRPVVETEYVPRQVSEQTNREVNVVDSPVNPNQQSGYSNYVPSYGPGVTREARLAPPEMTVAEAAARVKVAEAKFSQVFNNGGDISRGAAKTLQAELEFAKVQHAKALAEFEGRTKLLELDVRQAQADCEHAMIALQDATEISQRVSNAASKSEVTTRRAAVGKAEIDLERAKLMLDLHKQASRPKAKPNDSLDLVPPPNASDDVPAVRATNSDNR